MINFSNGSLASQIYHVILRLNQEKIKKYIDLVIKSQILCNLGLNYLAG
jgi:hypothetical protein